MRQIDNGGPAWSCKWCDRPAHIRQGRIWLCAMHYRMSSMRTRAKRDGKAVPTVADLERLVPTPLACAPCGRMMNWLRSGGASTQVTLQHDRDGTVRLICLGCNTRHAAHPDDTYYAIPSGHKYCPDCDRVLPDASFASDRSRPRGLRSYCRKCSSARHRSWRLSNVLA